MLTTEQLQEKLSNYYGSLTFTRITPWVILTEGAVAFAEGAEAWWLMTDIASVIPALPSDSFYDAELLVRNGGAVLTIGDGNGKVLYTHTYTHTDCPNGTWKFFIEQDWEHTTEDMKVFCILLPSEH